MKPRCPTTQMITLWLVAFTACVGEEALGKHGPPCASGYSDCGDGTCRREGTCPLRDATSNDPASPDIARADGVHAGETADLGGTGPDTAPELALADGAARDAVAADATSQDAGKIGAPIHLDMTSQVSMVLWDRQGARAYVAGSSKIHVVDMSTLSVESIIPYQGKQVRAMIEDGRLFLTDDFDNTYLEDVEAKTRRLLVTCSAVTDAALSHDQNTAAASGFNDRAVCVRKASQPPEGQVKLAAEDTQYLGVAFSDDDRLLYAHDGEFLDVYDVASLKLVERIATPTATWPRVVGAFVLIPQRAAILQITDTGGAVVALNGGRIDRLKLDHTGVGVSVSRDGRLGAVTTLTYDPTVGSLWLVELDTLATTKLFTSEEEENFVETGFLSPNGDYLFATYFYGQSIDVYKLR
jgi:hypothetical protein